jgi:hypothetical protein
MRKITCLTGTTQIGRVLDHARREDKISALVFVGDAMEEEPEELYAKARKLRAPVRAMFEDALPDLIKDALADAKNRR